MARGTRIRAPATSGEPWGPTRIVYLQNSSDPVVWFAPDLAVRAPDWLEEGERGPDVSDDFVWTPLVTMWQVLLDLPAAGSVPDGYGHNYFITDQVRAWAAIARPDGWGRDDTRALVAVLDAESPTATPSTTPSPSTMPAAAGWPS